MAKSKVEMIEVDKNELLKLQATLTEAAEQLAALAGDSEAADSGTEEGGDDETDTNDKDETPEEDFPSRKEIAKMKLKQLKQLAEALELEVDDDADEDALRPMLDVLAAINEEDTDELEAEAVNALATAAGLEPSKKIEKTLAAIADKFNSDSADGATSDDDAEEEEEKPKKKAASADDDDDDSGDDEDEKPAKKKKASDDDDDEDDAEEEEDEKPAKKKKSSDDDDEEASSGPDEDTVDEAVAGAELPDSEDMVARLEEFNKAADEDSQIEFDEDNAKSVKTAYKSLLRLLVSDEGALAEWGSAYIRAGEGYCCGLPLEEHTIKGDKRQLGKCAVTSTVFYLNDEDELVPLKSKK